MFNRQTVIFNVSLFSDLSLFPLKLWIDLNHQFPLSVMALTLVLLLFMIHLSHPATQPPSQPQYLRLVSASSLCFLLHPMW